MGLTGSSVSAPNRHLHFLLVVFMGVMAFGAILYWRHQTLIASEYVEFNGKNTRQESSSNLRSRNYQIETEEVSPSVN